MLEKRKRSQIRHLKRLQTCQKGVLNIADYGARIQ